MDICHIDVVLWWMGQTLVHQELCCHGTWNICNRLGCLEHIVSGSPWMDHSYAVFTGVLSLCIGVTVNLQDLRDVEGDRKSGRITMPIHFGMSTSRVFLSFNCLSCRTCDPVLYNMEPTFAASYSV